MEKTKLGLAGIALVGFLSSCCSNNCDKGGYKVPDYQNIPLERSIEKQYIDKFGKTTFYNPKQEKETISIKGYWGGNTPVELKIPRELFADKSSSIATADMDNDGDLDIIVASASGELSLIENKIPQKNVK